MSRLLCIGNGRVVLPHRVIPNGAVVVRDGHIEAVLENPTNQSCCELLDAQGGIIMPGFIDMHLHGGGGADFMDGTLDSFRTIARTHLIHGTTAMTPTTMTAPDEEVEMLIDTYHQVKREGTEGAQFLGLHMEGPYFSSVSKGAQPISSERTPDLSYGKRLLELGKGEIRRWDAAPELPGMEAFASFLKSQGILVSLAHSNATAQEAENAIGWRFSHVKQFYNAVTTIRKIRGRVYAGIVEAAYIHDEVTIELIGDGRHIPRQSMLLAYQIKGASQIALITDAMRAAGTNNSASGLGSIVSGVPVVVDDGVAQLLDRSSYAGSIGTMDLALRVAHLEYGIPLQDVSLMLSLTPARLCGEEKEKGSLEKGKDADVVVLDDIFKVRHAIVLGVVRYSAES